jgi:hypothetical protein
MAAHTFNNNKYLLSFVLLFLVLFTSACDQIDVNLAQAPEANQPQGSVSKAGSNTWIEFPAERETYPLEPMTFAIYAADAQGVSGIEVWVNGEALAAGAPVSLSSDGSKGLVRLDQIWLPQTAGTYVLQASGRGGSGQSESTHVTFCIVSCQPGAAPVTPSDTPTPAANITITPGEVTVTPTITPTGTVTVYPTAQIEFWAAPPYANAGQCTTLNWNVSGAQYVYLDGNQVNFSGSQQVCPCQTTTYTLSVYEMDGAQKDNKVMVTVSGTCQGPTTTPPPVTNIPPGPPPTTAPPPPPQDTAGPAISDVNLTGDDCQFYGQAYVDDESGINQVRFYYNHGQTWILMKAIGGGLFQTQVAIDDPSSGGMVSPPWTVDYYVIAVDASPQMNESNSGSTSKTLMGCGG